MAKKILIADDDRALVQSLAVYLNSHFPGLEPIQAMNGNEACTKFIACLEEGGEVAGAVLDHVMNGKDGVDVASVIRGRQETKGIPVVVMSCFAASPFMVRRAKELSFRSIGKPANPDEIFSVFRRP